MVLGSDPLGDFLAEPSVDGWDIIIAAVVLVVTWILSRLVKRTVLRAGGRLEGMSPDMRETTARVASYLVVLLGVGVALGQLGASSNPVLVVVLVVAIVLAVALRGVVENYAANVMIRSSHAIAVGDEIETQGYWG